MELFRPAGQVLVSFRATAEAQKLNGQRTQLARSLGH